MNKRSVQERLIKIETDVCWLKKLWWSFLALIAVNMIVTILNIRPISEWLFQ